MSLAKSKLTAQGQISVPAAVRRKLGVGPGSVLEWEEVDARILVRRAATYTSQDLHEALFESNLPAYFAPERPLPLFGDATRNRARSDAARLQQDDGAGVEQGRRNTGGLARAG